MLIFMEIWTKSRFPRYYQRYGQKTIFKVISKIHLFVFIFHMDKKQFFQSDIKKMAFSLNCDIFGDIGKNDFFKLPLPRNVDIYVDMEYSEFKNFDVCAGV